MHADKISGQTAAGRVYRLLRSRRGRWVSGWDLTIGARGYRYRLTVRRGR